MLTVQPFPWRRLSPSAQMEHCLDAAGVLRLRGADPNTPPLGTARVSAGGGFVDIPLARLHLVWLRAEDGDGWVLRSEGAPSTMTHLGARWGETVRAATAARGIDERFVLATLACEVGDIAPDASGYVKAPRTELGYPQRTGEHDAGDFARDAVDWRVSRGMHSSHGLMQTLIGVATMARPDLFKGIDPSLYRAVLWVPENSLACGLAHLAHFARDVLADPLASRLHYGAAIAHASTSNVWGMAPVYDDRVPLRFLAFWNDDAHVRAQAGPDADDVPDTLPSTERSPALAWLAALSSFALAAAAACGLSYFASTRRFAS
jgi:hypothetical protein